MTLPVDICATPYSYVLHDSFISVPRLVHMCYMTHSQVCHDTFILFVPRLIHMCYMTHSYMCYMAHSYLCHALFMCVKWLIHKCAMTYLSVKHDSLICVTWLIHMFIRNHHICDMANLNTRCYSLICIHWYVCQYSYICVPWFILMCAMTYSHVCHDLVLCVMYYLLYVCHDSRAAAGVGHARTSTVLQCVAMCCNVLEVCHKVSQCVAVCCSVLQCVDALICGKRCIHTCDITDWHARQDACTRVPWHIHSSDMTHDSFKWVSSHIWIHTWMQTRHGQCQWWPWLIWIYSYIYIYIYIRVVSHRWMRNDSCLVWISTQMIPYLDGG